MSSFTSSSLYNVGEPLNLTVIPKDLQLKQIEEEEGTKNIKLDRLAVLLRKKTQEQAQLVNAPFSSQQSTTRHEEIRQKLRMGNDDMLNTYNNELGNYRQQTSQMRALVDKASIALDVATLESKTKLSNIQSSNDSLSMLAVQRGLHAASDRQQKRTAKHSKWSNETLL
jgi:hypothetical protein